MARKTEDTWTKTKTDQALKTHLQQAEHHLISAVELFTGDPMLTRPTGYFARLVNAQESITGLHRQELVRVRGPLSSRRKK